MATPKPNKQNIIDAIIKGIEIGKERGNLLATVGKKWQLSQRTFDRYWKIANQQHTVKQQELKRKLAEVDEHAAIEARKKAIMTAEERKEYLTKLITGQIKVPYTEVKWNVATKQFDTIHFVELASHTARINAIAELNKMEGDYAPAKTQQIGKDGLPVDPSPPAIIIQEYKPADRPQIENDDE